MTPQEKAHELVDKYWFLNYGWDGVTKDQWAKEGALIAVDEILSFLEDDRESFSWKTYYRYYHLRSFNIIS